MASLTLYAEPETRMRRCCGHWHTVAEWVEHIETHEGGEQR